MPEFDPYLVHAPLAELLAMLGDQRAAYHKAEAEALWRHAWKRNEELADYMESVKDYATVADGSAYTVIRPYE
jgi:hypothetical protein